MPRNPTKLAQPDPDARRVDCAHVMLCLADADAMRWAGFSCRRCACYCPQSHDQYMLDMAGALALNNAIRGIK